MSHKFKRYDLEHHFMLPEYRDWLATRTEAPCFDMEQKLLSLGYISLRASSSVTSTRPHGLELCDFDEKRLEAMDKAGVDAAFLSATVGLEEVELPEIVAWCRKANDAVADYARRFPGRIYGTAVLPMMYPDEAVKELERCVKELGFRMWLTGSHYGKWRLYDSRYEALLSKVEELRCPFYLHPAMSNDPDLNAGGLLISSSGLGFGLDTMKTATRFIIDGGFDRHPNLRMILGHLGEYFPYVMDRMDNRFKYVPDPCVKMKHDVSYYFKNGNIVVTTSGNPDPEAFALAKKKLGIGNIFFGSDYPYENFNESVKFIESLDLTEDEQKALWCGNVERLILGQ